MIYSGAYNVVINSNEFNLPSTVKPNEWKDWLKDNRTIIFQEVLYNRILSAMHLMSNIAESSNFDSAYRFIQGQKEAYEQLLELFESMRTASEDSERKKE